MKAKKEGKQVLINNVTKFESEKLFGLVIGKKQDEHSGPIGNSDLMEHKQAIGTQYKSKER